MNPIRRYIPAAFAATLFAGAASRASAAAPEAAAEDRAVYHVNDVASAREALVNIKNHLVASPGAKLALVANGRGIFMLVQGEKDRVGEYAPLINELQGKGVRFQACRNSMTQKNVEPATLVAGVNIVPAGVAELTRLQVTERYAYIKP
ncbi:DsrE family protein [Ideonella sp.]|uniref:DsrE family protein n=1 Tax=Ideonella sp. TaxID=1929293 RepID=UPI0035B43B63